MLDNVAVTVGESQQQMCRMVGYSQLAEGWLCPAASSKVAMISNVYVVHVEPGSPFSLV